MFCWDYCRRSLRDFGMATGRCGVARGTSNSCRSSSDTISLRSNKERPARSLVVVISSVDRINRGLNVFNKPAFLLHRHRRVAMSEERSSPRSDQPLVPSKVNTRGSFSLVP